MPVRYVEAPIQAGLSFQEFHQVYKAPEPIYSCITCGGDSTVAKKETKEEFLAHGSIEIREIS